MIVKERPGLTIGDIRAAQAFASDNLATDDIVLA